ncbi:MAG: hypothetical protein PF588_00380, partial [Candidatus Kapabacteria bacterium]|nr:hypothetical protein [Candidatus Kapabacteria bacterium]
SINRTFVITIIYNLLSNILFRSTEHLLMDYINMLEKVFVFPTAKVVSRKDMIILCFVAWGYTKKMNIFRSNH